MKNVLAQLTVCLYVMSYCLAAFATPADLFGEDFDKRIAFARLYQDLGKITGITEKVDTVTHAVKKNLEDPGIVLASLHAFKHQLSWEEIRDLPSNQKLPLAFAARDAAAYYADPNSPEFNVSWAVHLFKISSQLGIQQSGLAAAYTYMLRDRKALLQKGYPYAQQFENEAYLFREVKIGCLPNNADHFPLPVSQSICDIAANEERNAYRRVDQARNYSSDLSTAEAGVILLLGLAALGVTAGVISGGAAPDSNSTDWARLNMDAVNRAELEFAFVQ